MSSSESRTCLTFSKLSILLVFLGGIGVKRTLTPSFPVEVSVCWSVCLSVETPSFPVETLKFCVFRASKGCLSVERCVLLGVCVGKFVLTAVFECLSVCWSVLSCVCLSKTSFILVISCFMSDSWDCKRNMSCLTLEKACFIGSSGMLVLKMELYI